MLNGYKFIYFHYKVNPTKVTNRLIVEKSPYLLQHEYDPIDWLTWCDKALNKAGYEGKANFLSITYICH